MLVNDRLKSMPTHEFMLLTEKNGTYADYMQHFNDPKALTVNDDLVLYMMDTMRWIPSINPSNPNEWSGFGLNYYGPTVINRTGAGKAARIFRLWVSMFQEGPSELKLTGTYEWLEDDHSTIGRFPKIKLSRDSVIKTVNDLAALAETAVSGQFYVLHMGV